MSTLVNVILPDVQASTETRGVALDAVGITGLRYPITVILPDGTRQQTICDAELTVPLDSGVRGTHMSRFVEALHTRRNSMSPDGVVALAREVSGRLDDRGAGVRLLFPLFV